MELLKPSRAFEPNWTNILFIIPMTILGFLAWPIYLIWSGGDIGWQEIVLFFLMYFFAILGIGVGYHRGLSHRSFKMNRLMHFLTLLGGASVAEGSALVWCSDHRRHHRYQDTDGDPYDINKGFWWAHIGWIFGSRTSTDFRNSPDLTRDRLMQHQHKYYALWFISTGILLPLLLGFLVGRPLQTFLLAGLFRLAAFQQVTYLINSYAHYFGKRPYSTDITARDSLICAILTQGEGWHNFHHRFPFDYRNGHRFYHYDPTKWVIFFSQFLGLTYDLKKTSALEIYRARLQTSKNGIPEESEFHKKMVEALEGALARWDALHLEWIKIKKDFSEKHDIRRKELKAELKRAKLEFRTLFAEWKRTRSMSLPSVQVHAS